MKNVSNTVVVTSSGEEIPSVELLKDKKHSVLADVDLKNRDIYLNFSSRLALYDFARSLLQEAVFGISGEKEFYPLIVNDEALVVEGARLDEESSRVFIRYAIDEKD